MPNKGTLELTLLGVDGSPASDPRTLVTFLRTPSGVEIGRAKVAFPPSPRRFSLPAFPEERAIACIITPERHRHREVGIFTLTDGETIRRQPNVFRLPHLWVPEFTKWASLPDTFKELKDLLGSSDDLRLKDGNSRRLLGSFTASTYDDVDPADRIVANGKATLLNLFAKLDSMKEPVFGRKPWFRFLTRVVEISRERMIALADAELLARVQEIHGNIDRFALYKRTPVGDHHKNIPPGFTVRRPEMVSIKSREDHGNVQLTVAPGTDAAGDAVTIVDMDIDENGKLMAHLGDLFKHKVTGGTHPFDIHEFLVLEAPGRNLGYTLV
jgi:hypothetical protein